MELHRALGDEQLLGNAFHGLPVKQHNHDLRLVLRQAERYQLLLAAALHLAFELLVGKLTMRGGGLRFVGWALGLFAEAVKAP